MPTRFAIALLAATVIVGPALAQGAPVPDQPDIIVYGRAIKLLGLATSGSEGTVGYEDFENRPLSRVGELAENVPGLIATQHSGSGKANQYFLRGFNLDHGTDLAGFVDGAPVNLRSHGHGQGWLDLNFIIPETIERIDFRKGPYSIEAGDFSAAGSIAFKTVDRPPAPIAIAEVGMFDYYRGLVAGSTGVAGGDLLVAIDGTRSNGSYDLDERLGRIKSLLKYSRGTADRGFDIAFTGYRSTWHSTDQVPRRAIDQGLIGLYGNIGPFLGGQTTRLGLTGSASFGRTKANIYATYQNFSLTSNFTYFLDDPVDGDEFIQRDRRGVFGGKISHAVPIVLAGLPTTFRIAAEGRYDLIGNVGLYQSKFGQAIRTIRQDSVDEASGALSGEIEVALTPRLRAIGGVRADLFGWDVRADDPRNSGSGSDFLVQPKGALAWKATDHLELYANYGESYHSNDVRGATIRFDPKSGEPAERVGVLARAVGYEGGARVEYARFNATLAVYHLDLDSELVFVGDAGTTEPNGATRRNGVEASLFWRPRSWLSLDAAAAFTHARFRDAPGADRIPNSADEVLAGGATIAFTRDIAVTARVRHFGSEPLIEDGSRQSRPTTVVNAGAYWAIGRAKIAVDLLNLFDSTDTDITYFYASRLAGEPAEGVDDFHLHPIEKRQVRASMRCRF